MSLWYDFHVYCLYNDAISFKVLDVNNSAIPVKLQKENAHDSPVCKCFFSPNDSLIITCDEAMNKVNLK